VLCEVGDPDADTMLVMEEESWAAAFVQLLFCLTKERLRFLLMYLEGFPLFSCFSLSDDDSIVQSGLARMSQQWRAWLIAVEKPFPFIQEQVRRSYMHTEIVKLMFRCGASNNFSIATPLLKQLAKQCVAGATTKPIEDAWQRVRSVEDRCQSNRKVTASRVWATCIHRGVASRVHKYAEVDFRSCSRKTQLEELGTKIPVSAHRPSAGESVLPLKSVVGTNSKPSWVTISPQSFSRMWADAAAWRRFLQEPDWHLGHRLWLCSLMLPGMLLRHVSSPEFVWSLGDVERVAALGWATESVSAGGRIFFRPRCHPTADAARSPYQWLVCVECTEWRCQPVEWRSMLVHEKTSTSSAAASASSCSLPPGLWAEESGEPCSLLQGAALQGFINMSLPLLWELVKFFEVECSPTATELDVTGWQTIIIQLWVCMLLGCESFSFVQFCCCCFAVPATHQRLG
jgi:hypothetical protein